MSTVKVHIFYVWKQRILYRFLHFKDPQINMIYSETGGTYGVVLINYATQEQEMNSMKKLNDSILW